MAEDVVNAIILYTGNISNDDSFYTVVAGDTLYSIARKYNTSVDELKRINNLISNNLSIGQVLKITEDNVSDYDLYTVIIGDTLYSISKKYNTTVDEIKRLNSLTNNNLSVGQVLKIPKSNGSNNTYITYIVVSGDSLYSIAKKYNTSVDEIKRLNNLTSNNLSIGQVLKIGNSSNNSAYTNYVVVKGDSLYAIARKYNTSVDEIKRFNNLTSNNLSIGQVIRIPG